MLDEYGINPFSTWENEMPKLVEDARYTVVTTGKIRKQIFSQWCQNRIAALKVEKEKEIKRDPRIAYLNFLELNATPKLYWPEFRRKYKKELEMKDPRVSDKDREKYYRDFISRNKISVETRENDLRKMLKTVKDITRSTPIDSLPPSIICDIRYVTVPKVTREIIVEEYLKTLLEDFSSEEEGAVEDRLEKQRKALEDREAAVRREQQYNNRDIARSKELLREKADEIRKAMNVGKEGLLGHLETANDEPPGSE